MIERRGSDIGKIVIALLALLVAVGGFAWWRSAKDAGANARLAEALATHEMPVVPPAPPAPRSPPPLPQPGTFKPMESG